MNARERLTQTLNHKQPDKVVLDIGSSLVTGISAVALSKLRDALGLEKRPVKVYEPMQMLGLVEDDLREALGIDVKGAWSPYTTFGSKNDAWKPWRFHEIDMLISADLTYDFTQEGDCRVYPKGDKSVDYSAWMPKGGFYFDNHVRQGNIDESVLDGKNDFANDFPVMSDEVVADITAQVEDIYNNTEYGINVGNFMCGFGDVAALPGPGQKETKGIRSVEDWLMAHYLTPDYVHEVYEMQLQNALQTLTKLKAAIGDKPQVIQISGTDFGTQRCEFIAPDMYRTFYKPYHTRINEWVHQNTGWKTMFHSCGSIVKILDDLAETGVDILNPVQCSATDMDAKMLKEKYGDKFVFWGGGVETQGVLSNGSADDVRKEVRERLAIFAPGGGFVFNTVHNIQATTPVENMLAMFEVLGEYNAK